MGFVPNNLCVYIYAFCGCQAGLVASGKYPNDPSENDYDYASLKADAYAQAIDEAWGSGAYTNADLQQLFGCSYGIWALGRSPIADPTGNEPAAYGGVAIALVAAVRSGTRQIVSEGIDPNGCGGGGGDGGSGGVLVWRPGGTLETGVVTTWAEVASAIASSNVPLTVYVDSSIAAAIIPGSSGVTDCRGTTRMLSYNWSRVSQSVSDTVEIEDGATLYRLREIAEGIQVTCDAITTASLSFSTAVEDTFTVRDEATLLTGAAAAVAAIQLAAGQSLVIYTHGDVLVEASTVSPVISLTSTSILYWNAYDQLSLSAFGTHFVDGPAGAEIVFTHDLSTLPGWPLGLTGFLGTFIDNRLFPAPGTAPYNPAWFALTDIYWDPANSTSLASDSNDGASATTPVLTWGEIVQRYGSTSPEFNYGQSITINVMSAQVPGTDPIFFEPRLSGGGQAILNCFSGLASAGASFLCGALSGGFGYAGATPSAGGSPMTIAGVPSSVVAKVLLYNSARSSYAFVDSVAGGNATMQQPQTSASITTTTAIPAPAVDNDWVADDTIEAFTCPLLNLKRWSPVGSDLTSGAQPCSGWVLFARIYDPSGSAASAFNFFNQAAINVLSCCQVDTRLDLSILGGRSSSSFVIGCTVAGQVVGVIYGAGLFGGGMAAGAQMSGAGGMLFSNNVLLHGSVTVTTLLEISTGGAYASGSIGVFPGASVDCIGTFWGAYSVTVEPGGIYWNNTGSTFEAKALLTSGTLALGTQNTGTSYTPGTGLWVSGISLTSANIDANSGLQDPLTGARFCNTA